MNEYKKIDYEDLSNKISLWCIEVLSEYEEIFTHSGFKKPECPDCGSAKAIIHETSFKQIKRINCSNCNLKATCIVADECGYKTFYLIDYNYN